MAYEAWKLVMMYYYMVLAMPMMPFVVCAGGSGQSQDGYHRESGSKCNQ
jgi:hypothetical protein